MGNHVFIRIPLVGLAVIAPLMGCQSGGSNGQVLPDQSKRFEVMRAKGTQASMTVFPVVIGDSAALNNDVASVVALLLEKAGLTSLETTDAIFRLPKEADFAQAAELFGQFVRENPIETDYAFHAEIVGTFATGPKEIRFVIVDSVGQGVLVDRQTRSDRAFKRAKPSDPMTCCHFLAERVRVQLGIPESARDESGQGKIARKFAEDSPAPSKAEWAAMKRRQAAMKKAGRSAKLAVFPVRLSNNDVRNNDAARLAELLNERKLFEANSMDSHLRVKIKPTHNEQRILWGLARTFQDHIKRNPPAADYVLLADYIMHAGSAWAVHFVICDRNGEWVIVDFQNSHHGDFRSIDPKTLDDCGRLVAKRLSGYLQ